MLLNLDSRSHTPIWEQIVNQIKELVIKGILKPNDQILPVRELSTQLLINPNTVSKAYRELERQGIIATFRGRGSFIAENLQLQPDEKSINKIRQDLKRIIIDASYHNIDSDTISLWTKELIDEIGGKKSADN